MNLVSSGSTLRGRFSGYSLVRLSQTTIVAVLHCKLTNRLVVKTCTMKMINEARSTLPGPLVPLGRRGELIVAGQVAMATGRDGRRTMPTGGAGSPTGKRPSGTRVEDATGAWTVRPLHGASPGIGQANEGRANGAQIPSLTTVQSTAQSTASCSIVQYYAGEGEAGSFAGSSLAPRTKTSCGRMWWTACRSKSVKTGCFGKWSAYFILYCIEQNFIQL